MRNRKDAVSGTVLPFPKKRPRPRKPRGEPVADLILDTPTPAAPAAPKPFDFPDVTTTPKPGDTGW